MFGIIVSFCSMVAYFIAILWFTIRIYRCYGVSFFIFNISLVS